MIHGFLSQEYGVSRALDQGTKYYWYPQGWLLLNFNLNYMTCCLTLSLTTSDIEEIHNKMNDYHAYSEIPSNYICCTKLLSAS